DGGVDGRADVLALGGGRVVDRRHRDADGRGSTDATAVAGRVGEAVASVEVQVRRVGARRPAAAQAAVCRIRVDGEGQRGSLDVAARERDVDGRVLERDGVLVVGHGGVVHGRDGDADGGGVAVV